MYECLFFTKTQRFVHIFTGSIEDVLAIFYGYDFFERVIMYKTSGRVIKSDKHIVCEINR